MNRNRFAGNLNQLKGKVREQWEWWTHRYSSVFTVRINQLASKIQSLRLQVQMVLSGSPPLALVALGRKSDSRIVVHGIDLSGSAGTAAPTIDMVERNILVAQERVAPLAKVSTCYDTAWSRGFGREPVRILNSQMRLRRE